MADKMAAKIKALLDLAEHPNTPKHERLAASEKAAELMEKYAIDELMARGDHGKADKVVKREYHEGGSYWLAERDMYNRLAESLGMKCVYVQPSPYGKVDLKLYVYGFEADFTKFETLLASMHLQCAAAWKQFRKGLDIPNDTVFVNTKRSFMMGYAVGFGNKVAAGRNHAVHEAGTGAELVLVDRSKRVADFMKEQHPRLKQATSLKINGAYHHGRTAGSQASTGDTPLGGKGELR